MCGEDGSVLLVGNNEIYNAVELRRELEELGHRFANHSDTEVMVHAYEQWGGKCFERLSGMYAVAIVDQRRRRLVLARDHIGIKPLHYARYKGGWLFASEAKPILSVDGFLRRVDRESLHLFLNFRYVPTDDTLFEGIKRLPPGCYAEIDENGSMNILNHTAVEQWGSVKLTSKGGALEEMETVFRSAVHGHLMADVPVGVYLSGGVDSSLVAAYAAKAHGGIHSYCMTFGEPTDEDRDAQLVADHIGSEHKTLFVGQAPLSLTPAVLWHVEEPKVNALQGFILAEAVSQHVKVVLSGLGGDELFAGYTNNDILYPMAMTTGRLRLPPPPGAFRAISRMQGLCGNPRRDMLFRMADLALCATDPVAFYCVLRNCFDHSPYLMSRIYRRPEPELAGLCARTMRKMMPAGRDDILGKLMLMEMTTKMVNDFLLTEDRVSMANGVEVRVPFLERDNMRLAMSMPTSWKYRPGMKKAILKEFATQTLPASILRKPKWGFSFNPYLQFGKDLRQVAVRELTPGRLAELEIFNPVFVSSILETPPSRSMRWHYFFLWVLVGYSMWHRMFIESLLPTPPVSLDGVADAAA